MHKEKTQQINDKCSALYRQAKFSVSLFIEAAVDFLLDCRSHQRAEKPFLHNSKLLQQIQRPAAMSLRRPHLSSIAQKWQGALANVSSRLKFPDCRSGKMVFIINHTCFQFLVPMATAQKHRNRRKEWEVRQTLWSARGVRAQQQ